MMKAWQEQALKKLEAATERMKEAIVTAPDHGYTRVDGEIDVWLHRVSERERLSVKLFEPI